MQVECIRAFGHHKPGDVVDGVPDGASVDPVHWREVAAAAGGASGRGDVPASGGVPAAATGDSLPAAVAAARAELGGLAERVIPGKEGM